MSINTFLVIIKKFTVYNNETNAKPSESYKIKKTYMGLLIKFSLML